MDFSLPSTVGTQGGYNKIHQIPYTNIKNNKIMNDNSKSINNIKENTQPSINLNNKKHDLKKRDNSIEKMNTKMKVKKEMKNFCTFLIYVITCRKKFNYYNVYKDFRIKIISEEHLIKNHLTIYNLLKVTEKKRSYRRNSYQLTDLIKLV